MEGEQTTPGEERENHDLDGNHCNFIGSFLSQYDA